MSQPPEDPGPRAPEVPCPTPPDGEFSAEERRALLKLAHTSIEAAVKGEPSSTAAPTPHLAENRGAFTTLHIRGQLRGCVGYVLPVAPLYRTVAETARAAALEDFRFPQVAPEELPDLRVNINVLSPLFPIRAEQVEVGCHGLLVSAAGHRGLLLPEVATEHGWDRTTFLEQTCRKAGLPADAWRQGAQLEAFTTESFSDEP